MAIAPSTVRAPRVIDIPAPSPRSTGRGLTPELSTGSRSSGADRSSGVDRSSGGGSATEPAIRQAQEAVRLLSDRYDRNGWDGRGGTLQVVLDARDERGQPVRDAMWDIAQRKVLLPSPQAAGDRKELLRTFDVLSHEVIHGVLQADVYRRSDHLANPVTRMGPRSVSESWADVLTSTLDGNWTMGERAGAPVRDLRRPTMSHVSDMQRMSYDEHLLSGIPSLAAVRTADAIGMRKMGDVWYRAMRHLDPEGWFPHAASATRTAAAELFGPRSREVAAVRQAWESVGV